MGDLKLTYQVDGGDLLQAGEASSQMKMALKKLDLPPEVIRKASICMYEGEINMVIHANGGEITVTISPDQITMVLKDAGPGIPDIQQAMQAGWTTFMERLWPGSLPPDREISPFFCPPWIRLSYFPLSSAMGRCLGKPFPWDSPTTSASI